VTRPPDASPRTPAVVVGLCTHGLAIVRSLGRRGIPVVALESNPRVPGRRTRYAEAVDATDVNGPALISDLVRLRDRFRENPVLFLTNDNMVRVVAEGLAEIRSRYTLLWSESEVVRRLLDKREIESIARSTGLGYPRSQLVSKVEDLARLRGAWDYPVAFKPTKPLSGFKAMRIEREADLARELQRFQGRIENFLVQEWVTGMEPSIYFANFYFDEEHRPLARFVGRKVRAFPRNLGGACSAEPADRPDIAEEALRFFRSVPVRGPASLEIKEDESGRRFVIEPTIGRFDFYILCCIANGVDFPYLSYQHQTGGPLTPPPAQVPGRGRMWVDFESDMPALLSSWGIPGVGKEAVEFVVRPKVFAMWAWDDVMPSVGAWPRSFWRLASRVVGKLGRMLRLR
jgi:D-aspartate ligase